MSDHRAVIAMRKAQGGFTSTYLHLQGHQASNKLREHYADAKAVAALIKLGDLANLGDAPATCVSFHRDHDWDWDIVKPAHAKTSEQLARHALALGAEFIYLFTDEQWVVLDVKYLAQWSSRDRRYVPSTALVEAMAA